MQGLCSVMCDQVEQSHWSTAVTHISNDHYQPTLHHPHSVHPSLPTPPHPTTIQPPYHTPPHEMTDHPAILFIHQQWPTVVWLYCHTTVNILSYNCHHTVIQLSTPCHRLSQELEVKNCMKLTFVPEAVVMRQTTLDLQVSEGLTFICTNNIVVVTNKKIWSLWILYFVPKRRKLN